MTIPVVNVTCDVFQITGQGLPNAQVFLDLTRLDKYTVGSGGVVPAGRTVIPCDASGHGVGQAFPNDLGTQGTQYRVTVVDQYGNVVFPAPGEPPACARLPASDCALHAVMFTGPQMSTDDATAQVLLSMKWAMLESGTVDGTYFSSAEYAHGSQAGTGGSSRNWAQYLGGDVPGASALSRSAMSWSQDDLRGATYGGSSRDWAIGSGLIDGVTYYSSRQYAINSGNSAAAALASQQQADRDAQQTSADRTQTGLDRTQTGLDRAAADGDVQTGRGYMLTAVAQASLATVMAASASSVAQQDLSGVTAAALHRSPNAVVAMCIDDVSKHSDGGAWVEKCGSLSYVNGRTLNGAWIPHPTVQGIQSEIVARALGGTLGTNLAAAFNGTLTGWVAGGSAALSLVNGRTRVTNGATSTGTAQVTVALTSGQTYLLSADLFTQAGTAAPFVRVSADGGATWNALASTTAGAGVFTASVTGNHIVQFVAGTNVSGLYFDAGNLVVQQVTAFAPSGSYYPNATDGKFYRLWKNLFGYSEFQTGTASLSTNVGLVSNSALAGYDGALAFGYDGATAATVYKNISAIIPGAACTISVVVKMGDGNAPSFSATTALNDFTLVVGTVAISPTTYTVAPDPTGVGYYRVTGSVASLNNGSSFGVTKAAGNSNRTFITTAWQVQYASSFDSYEKKTTVDSGQTETFDGNTGKYPQPVAWVAEASRVVGYDLTQPGRPMWMVFGSGANSFLNWSSVYGAAAVSSLSAVNGWLVIGTGGGGVVCDFAKDTVKIFDSAQYNANPVMRTRYIAARNATGGYAYSGGPNDAYQIAQRTVNSVSACTMTDAPVDSVTGLQVPMIAVGTSGGLSLIKHDGSVVSSASASPRTHVLLNQYMVASYDSAFTAFQYALAPSKLGASFAESAFSSGSIGGFMSPNNTGKHAMGPRGAIARITTGAQMNLLRLNEMSQFASLFATITPTANTGWMVGDVRRCMFSDVSAGATQGNILAAADSNFSSDTGFWSKDTGVSITGGAVVFNNVPGSQNALYRVAAVPSLTAYTVKFTVTSYTAGGVRAVVNGAFGTTRSAPGTYTETIVGLSGGGGTGLYASAVGTTLTCDDLVIAEAVNDRSYKAKPAQIFGTLTKTAVASAAQLVFWGGFSATNYAQEPYSADWDFASGFALPIWLTGITAAASTFYDRSAAGGGASVTWGTDATGKLTATVVDSVGGTRTVTTTAAYVGVPSLLAELSLSTSGTLTIKVNGEVAGQTTGAPLATLANATAVVTWGNNRALTAAFPGSIALARPTATIPSDDASRFIYQQEQAMFRAGAQVTLPDSGALVDLDYDPTEDKWKVVSAANESTFVGLVRTAATPVPAGSYTHVAHRSGMKLLSRSTTNPGVDVTLPSLNAKEEFLKRAEAAAKLARLNEPFDWSGQFTATTTNGSTALTNVASLSYPSQASIIGAKVSGSGIPAGAYVTDVQGTTVYISAPATAGASGVSISIVSFPLPAGYEVKAVYTGGTGRRREGSGWDFTRAYDGFREQVVFSPSAPGNVNVQFDARRIAS